MRLRKVIALFTTCAEVCNDYKWGSYRLWRFRVPHTVCSLRLFLREFVRMLSKGLLIWKNQCRSHHVCVAIIPRNNYRIAELLKRTELHSSFLTLWHKFQQEDKRGIPSRNSSNNDNQAPRVAHTWYRMQGCVIHWGIKTVGREPSWCRLNSEHH